MVEEIYLLDLYVVLALLLFSMYSIHNFTHTFCFRDFVTYNTAVSVATVCLMAVSTNGTVGAATHETE